MKKYHKIALAVACAFLIVICFLFKKMHNDNIDLNLYDPHEFNFTFSMKDIEVLNTYNSSVTSNNKKRKVKLNIDNDIYEVEIDKIKDYLLSNSTEEDRISFELIFKDDNMFTKSNKINALAYSNDIIDKSIKLNYLAKKFGLIVPSMDLARISINGNDEGYFLLSQCYDKKFLEENNFKNAAIVKIKKDDNYRIDVLCNNSIEQNIKKLCKDILSESKNKEYLDDEYIKNMGAVNYILDSNIGINEESVFLFDINNMKIYPIMDSSMINCTYDNNLINLEAYISKHNDEIETYVNNSNVNLDDFSNNGFTNSTGIINNKAYLKKLYIGNKEAYINEKDKIIFVNLPKETKVINNIKYELNTNKDVFIRDDQNQKVILKNNANYNFKKYIYQGEITIDGNQIPYDIFITTGQANLLSINTEKHGKIQPIDLKNKNSCKMIYMQSGGKLQSLTGGIEIYEDENQPKKNYSIKLNNGYNIDELEDVREIVLDGIDSDESLIRKKLMLDIMQSINKQYDQKSQFVELLINGEYAGLYVMSPKIDEDFLKLDDYDQDDEDNNALLFKATDVNADFTPNNILLNLHNKKYEDFPKGLQPLNKDDDPILGWHSGYKQKVPHINEFGERWSKLEELIKFVATASDEEFNKNIFNIIDKKQYIEACVISQMIGAASESVQNQYLWKEKGENQKFKFIPNEYHKAFGLDNNYNKIHAQSWVTNSLFNRCMNIPEFNNEFWIRVKQVTLDDKRKDFISNKINEYQKIIDSARIRNYLRWKRYYSGVLSNINSTTREIEDIENWMNNRWNWLKAESVKH